MRMSEAFEFGVCLEVHGGHIYNRYNEFTDEQAEITEDAIDSHDQLTDENARLREALNEIIRLVRHPLTMDVMDISNTTEMNNAIRILNKDTK